MTGDSAMKKTIPAAVTATLLALTLASCSAASGDVTTSDRAPAANSSEAAAPDPVKTEDPPAPKAGTFANPAPAGTQLSGSDPTTKAAFTLDVTSVNPAANSEVAAANMFNDAPRAGFHYVRAAVKVADTDPSGTVSPSTVALATQIADQSGATYKGEIMIVDDPLLTTATDLQPGTNATGNLVFQVPDTATALFLSISGYFIALQ